MALAERYEGSSPNGDSYAVDYGRMRRRGEEWLFCVVMPDARDHKAMKPSEFKLRTSFCPRLGGWESSLRAYIRP